MTENKIIEYRYAVEAKKTMLLIGEDLDIAEDVEGWNINLVKYEIWSDGDKVLCNCMPITATVNEKQIKHLKDVVKTSCVFMVAFELGISQSKAYNMFE
jgi:hypothetical protein